MDASSTDGVDTLLLGLDAASPTILADLVEAGAVPNLQDVLEGGVSGPLRSQVPPWTPSAWPSIYTGVNPGKHGAFDFLAFDGYDWEVVDRTHVREHALWELLAEHGKRSVVVNVPVTHPALPFDGALLPGYTAPEEPACHPDGILDEVREAIGGYHLYDPRAAGSPTDEERVEGYLELTRMRGAAFRYLADRFDPDFGFLQFQQTDSVFHELSGDPDAVEAVYAAVDEEVGAVLEATDPDTVLVVSDHGIGPYGGYEFRVNEFLARHGFVETTRDGEGMPSWTAAVRGEADGSPGTLARLMALAASVGLTSQRIGAALDLVGLVDVVARHAPTDAIRAGTERVDFASSTAYVRSRIELGVRVNLQGREPAGTVPPEAYDDVREALVSLLADARTPEGEPVFEEVLPREAVFSGPYLDEGPDVVTIPAAYDHLLTASIRGGEFGAPSETHEHKPVGLFAAAGEGVDASADLSGAHLFDVAPTVLASLGLPASDRMDGRTLPVFEPAGTRSYQAFEVGAVGGTDDATVERRLTDLGYLE